MASHRVPIREFKARLSHYLAQATAQYGVIEVTSHKKVVARVTGVPAKAPEGVAALIASGGRELGRRQTGRWLDPPLQGRPQRVRTRARRPRMILRG